MPRTTGPRFSDNVAARVLAERGLEGQVSKAELAAAAEAHDAHNEGYLSRDELELAASDVAKALGTAPGVETARGLSFSRELLDRGKVRLAERGVYVDDADLARVLAKLDDGDGRVAPDELERALVAVAEAARLERLEGARPPARPDVQAEAEGAVDALARRKLASTFRYAGSGPVKVAFFDADSTLRVSRSGEVSANAEDDVALLPFVADKLKALADDGYLIAVVSNQMGVLYGHVSIEDADAALQRTADQIRSLGGEVHYVDFAEKRNGDRKPGGGMATRLESLLTTTFGPEAVIDKAASFMCGDSAYKASDTRPDGSPGTHFSNSDRLFAETVGLRFEEPADTFGWRAYGVNGFEDIHARARFLDEHRVGHRATKGPLGARLDALTDT